MIGTILGILGIVITLVFGGYSIWAYKNSKRNVSLEFQNKECYSLFREDVNRLNIEVIYNKTHLNNTLVLLKAKLINNGQVDIDKNRIYSPLKIKSSNDYKWLEATATSSPSGAKTNIQLLNEQEIQLNWDLLKQNEFIEIEALAEITSDEQEDGEKGIEFYNSLSFDYRITDLNSIQKEKQISNSIRKRSIFNKMTKIMAFVTIVLGIIFLSFEFFPHLNFMEKQVVSYTLNKDNTHISAIISTKTNEDIVVITTENEKIEIPIKEFNDSYEIIKIEKLTTDPKSSLFNRLIGIIYIIMGIIILLLKRKRKKLLINKDSSGRHDLI